jgi:hypothetical protein
MYGAKPDSHTPTSELLTTIKKCMLDITKCADSQDEFKRKNGPFLFYDIGTDALELLEKRLANYDVTVKRSCR